MGTNEHGITQRIKQRCKNSLNKATHTQSQKEKLLLAAVKMAYQKHYMRDTRIKRFELGDELHHVLSVALGDDYLKWLGETVVDIDQFKTKQDKNVETIYHHKEIKDVNYLRDIASICYDSPEECCACKQCFKYNITIDKIDEIKREA